MRRPDEDGEPAPDVSVVLVHGAWADGSSWSEVIRGLRAQGVPSTAVSLPLTSPAEDVAALERALERTEGPVVLAGHAYAGAVMGEARSERVKSLVYVTALAPDEGETVSDVFTRAQPHPGAPELAPDRHGFIWLPGQAFADAFAQDASEDERAVLAAVQRPIALECITTPVGRPAWKDTPAWFLIAENDRMISVETQLFMAKRMNASVRSVPTDHAPLITAPQHVVDIILDALRTG